MNEGTPTPNAWGGEKMGPVSSDPVRGRVMRGEVNSGITSERKIGEEEKKAAFDLLREYPHFDVIFFSEAGLPEKKDMYAENTGILTDTKEKDGKE